MLTRPADLGDVDVVAALRDGWGLDVDAVEHAPVGYGSYHWHARADGREWFATADDLALRRRHRSESLPTASPPVRRAASTSQTAQVNGEELAADAARVIAARTGATTHDVALVLGSGWAGSADKLGATRADLPTTDVPGFAASAVTGHQGRIRSIDVEGRRVLVFVGRTHLYEHRDPVAVAHPVRVAAACGCRVVVLTNACGAINETFRPGDLVVISDHVNMTAVSPLEGATFVDLSDLYSQRLRAICQDIDPSLAEGVYVGYWGPNYETPAEIRAYRTFGGDLVGMSTVLEAIAARAAGMEVLGLSLVTNMAAGIAGPLSHEEVLEQGRAGEQRAGTLLAAVLAAILRD